MKKPDNPVSGFSSDYAAVLDFSVQHNNPERMPPSKAAANAVNGEAINVAKAAIKPPNIFEITG